MLNNRAVLITNQRSRGRDHAETADTVLSVRPIDRLFGFYLGAAGIALAFPHRPAAWPILAVVHLAALFIAVAPQTVNGWLGGRRLPGFARVLADWYPLL